MHCSPLQLKVFATILFVAANAMNQANAQTSAPATEDTILLPTPQPIKLAMPHLEAGEKLILITSKDPTVKRTCRLESTSGDEIRCQQQSHSTIYSMADLDAIIQPGTSRWERLGLLVPFAIGGGIITGACFLAEVSLILLIPAIPIGLAGVSLILMSLAYADEGSEPAKVLYQKPGTTIAVKLR